MATPIHDLALPPGTTRAQQRDLLDRLKELTADSERTQTSLLPSARRSSRRLMAERG